MSWHWTLTQTFVADHFHDLPGFVEARHGHNWIAEATILADAHEESERLAPALEAWIQSVDYTLLNTQEPLAGRNPTAEALAEWLFRHLQEQGLRPHRVLIREKHHYWAAVEGASEG